VSFVAIATCVVAYDDFVARLSCTTVTRKNGTCDIGFIKYFVKLIFFVEDVYILIARFLRDFEVFNLQSNLDEH